MENDVQRELEHLRRMVKYERETNRLLKEQIERQREQFSERIRAHVERTIDVVENLISHDRIFVGKYRKEGARTALSYFRGTAQKYL